MGALVGRGDCTVGRKVAGAGSEVGVTTSMWNIGTGDLGRGGGGGVASTGVATSK